MKHRPDIYVRIIENMPDCLYGMVMEDCDGGQNIYLNAKCSIESQRAAYAHELKHIKAGHLRSNKTAEECEAEAEYG